MKMLKMLKPQQRLRRLEAIQTVSAEKRNSVNPLLIPYNGSLVVCPARTSFEMAGSQLGR